MAPVEVRLTVEAVEVRLTTEVARELAELGRQRRGTLTMAIGARARSGPRDGPLLICTHQDAAACEVLREGADSERRRVVLVYAIRSRWLLLAQLFGPELDRRFSRLQVQRLLHRG